MFRYFLILLLFVIPLAHADELFIPNTMLISEEYSGIFIREDSENPLLLTLVSNSDILSIPDSIYLDAGKNHALFDVTLYGFGDADVIARDGDTFYNSTVSITSDIKSDYNLLLMVPEKTSTSNLDAMIFVTDDFFNPISVKEEISISFATVNVDAPDTLIIPAGESHVLFNVDILGDGSITAYTEKSASNTVTIEYSSAQKKVRMGIAPESIAPSSFGYVFVWLEENGLPAHPTLPIKSSLHTSEHTIVGVEGLSKSDSTVYIRDGVLMKRINTHHTGNATITANVPGYGVVSETVFVDDLSYSEQAITKRALDEGCDVSLIGTSYEARWHDRDIHRNGTTKYLPYVNCDSTNFKPSSKSAYLDHFTPDGIADTIRTFVFPSITSEVAYLVWSLYDTVESDMYPIFDNTNTEFFITSQNLKHENMIPFETGNRQTQSQITTISGRIIGNHDISVSSSVSPEISVSSLEIASPAKHDLLIHVLPTLSSSDARNLFAVSVVNSEGYVINPHDTFGDLQVTLLSNQIGFAKKSIYLKDAVTVISGISNVSYPSVTILANNQDIMNYNSYRPSSTYSVDIQMPNRVHSGESFPAYAFLLDENGNVISDIRELLTGCKGVNGIFSCTSDGEFILFENSIGFTSKSMDVFYNIFEDDDVSFDIEGIVGIGAELIIPYTIPKGASLDVITDFPFAVNEDTVIVTPEVIGEHKVSFLISKVGFETIQFDESFAVDSNISLLFKSVTSAGVSINTTVSISENNNSIVVKTPDTAKIPRGSLHFEFEPSLIIDSSGYSFESVLISNQTYFIPIIDVSLSQPTEIVTTYSRVVHIDAENAIGGGVYDYGDIVTIHAPTRNVVSFLIRDTFEYWDNLPVQYDGYSNPLIISATESFQTNAVYREDYSGLVFVIVFAALFVFGFIRRDRILGIIRTYTEKR